MKRFAVIPALFAALLLASPALAEDGREPIYLTVDERDQVLAEMRELLEAVQAITEYLAAGDMENLAITAASVGMVLAQGENPATVAKLPKNFILDGVAAHTAFDQLGQNARDFGDANMLLEELSVILSACTACHAGYRLAVESD